MRHDLRKAFVGNAHERGSTVTLAFLSSLLLPLVCIGQHNTMMYLFVSWRMVFTLFVRFGIGECTSSSPFPSVELPLLAKIKSTPL
jgi:hypothetical membrane protein